MNKKQRTILTIGVLLVIGSCFIPPWTAVLNTKSRHVEEPYGYRLIIAPPVEEGWAAWGFKLDTTRLFLQIFSISLAAGFGVLVSKD